MLEFNLDDYLESLLQDDCRICKKCGKLRYSKLFYAKDTWCRFCSRNYHKLHQSSLWNKTKTLKIKTQSNRCAICNELFKTKAALDHCHKTGKIRGVLCINCNSGLGFFKDNIPILKAAISYLERHRR